MFRMADCIIISAGILAYLFSSGRQVFQPVISPVSYTHLAGQKEPVIDMHTRFVDFMRVLVPMAGDDTTPEGEQVNIYGNHVGSWNFAATADLYLPSVKISCLLNIRV